MLRATEGCHPKTICTYICFSLLLLVLSGPPFRPIFETSFPCTSICLLFVTCLAFFQPWRWGAAYSSEISVNFYWNIWQLTPWDNTLQNIVSKQLYDNFLIIPQFVKKIFRNYSSVKINIENQQIVSNINAEYVCIIRV